MLWHLVRDCYVPTADKHRSHRIHNRIEACRNATFYSAEVCFSGRKILLGREEQSHIDWHTGKNRLFNSRKTLLGARNLDEDIRPGCACKENLRRSKVLVAS